MLARQPQARLWNRTNSNFPKTQGPVARKKSQKATQILRAGNVLPTPRGNPRKWGPGPTPPVRGRWPEGPEGVGWATMSTKCSSGAVPGGVLVTLPPWAKSLAARRRRNSPAHNKRNPKPAPSSVTALPCHLSLSPLSLRDIIPTPFGLRPFPPDRGNRPLDKGRRPPRGRLLGGFGPLTKKGSRKAGQRRGGEIPRTLHLLWLKPPQSGFNKEGSTHETNPMRKRRNLQT